MMDTLVVVIVIIVVIVAIVLLAPMILGKVISSTVGGVTKPFTDAIGGVANFFGGIPNAIGGALGGAANAIGGFLGGAAGAIPNPFAMLGAVIDPKTAANNATIAKAMTITPTTQSEWPQQEKLFNQYVNSGTRLDLQRAQAIWDQWAAYKVPLAQKYPRPVVPPLTANANDVQFYINAGLSPQVAQQTAYRYAAHAASGR